MLLNEQQIFLNSYILADNGTSFRNDYRMWLRVYRDTLTDQWNFDEQGDAQAKPALPKATRMKLIEDAHEKTMKTIIVKQQELLGELYKLRLANPR